jgi:hypothetical protein
MPDDTARSVSAELDLVRSSLSAPRSHQKSFYRTLISSPILIMPMNLGQGGRINRAGKKIQSLSTLLVVVSLTFDY